MGDHDDRPERVPVFGNGTGFVWYSGGAQQQEVVERVLVHEVETRLVAVHESERGLFGQAGEGIGDAIETIARGLGGGLIFEQPGFDGPRTGRRQ